MHDDIVAFARQFRETPEEQEARTQALLRTRLVLQKVHRRAEVHVYGSSATGMRLPLGDTDLMIEAPGVEWAEERTKLVSELSSALRKERLPRTLLAKGAMLKWADHQSGVKFDACVNNVAGLRSTAMLGHAAAASPAIIPLVQILKAQLLLHGVHQTYNGGVNGYLLANMVRHLLGRRRDLAQSIRDQVESATGASKVLRAHSGDHDLGGLLLLFYWYYGFKVDTGHTLRVVDGAGRGRPEKAVLLPHASDWLKHGPTNLSLVDPADATNDLGASAYRFGTVVRTLLRTSYARLMLGRRLSPEALQDPHVSADRDAKFHHSMLSDVSGVDESGNVLADEIDYDIASSALVHPRTSEQRLFKLLPKWRASLTNKEARECNRAWAKVARRRRFDQAVMRETNTVLARDELKSDPMWG